MTTPAIDALEYLKDRFSDKLHDYYFEVIRSALLHGLACKCGKLGKEYCPVIDDAAENCAALTTAPEQSRYEELQAMAERLAGDLEHALRQVKKHVFYGEYDDRGCKLEFPSAEKALQEYAKWKDGK